MLQTIVIWEGLELVKPHSKHFCHQFAVKMHKGFLLSLFCSAKVVWFVLFFTVFVCVLCVVFFFFSFFCMKIDHGNQLSCFTQAGCTLVEP